MHREPLFNTGAWLVIDLAEKAVTAAVVDAQGSLKPCIQGRGEVATRFFSAEIFLSDGPYQGDEDERFARLLKAMDGLKKGIWPSFELLGWQKPKDSAYGRDAPLTNPLGMASSFAWDGEDPEEAERFGILVHLFVLAPVEEVARQINGGHPFAGAVLIVPPSADQLARKVARKAMRRLGVEHVLLLERDHALALCAHYRRGALETNCLSFEENGLRLTRVGVEITTTGLECRSLAGAWLGGAGWEGFAASVAETLGPATGTPRVSVEEAERLLLGLFCGATTATMPVLPGGRLTFSRLERDRATAWHAAFRKRLSAGLANLEQDILIPAGGSAVGWGLPFALNTLPPLLGNCVFGDVQTNFTMETPFFDRAIVGVAALLAQVLRGDGFAARLTSGQGLHLWSGGASGVELVSGQALCQERGERRKYFQAQRLARGEDAGGDAFAARILYGFTASPEGSATVGTWSGVIPRAALSSDAPLLVETEISRDRDTGELDGTVEFSMGTFRSTAKIHLPADVVMIGPVVE
jgi:hypothetical protein